MALFENFPYTNLHELNLDWLVDQLNHMTESQVLSVNGMTGQVTLYENPAVMFPSIAQDSWQILRLADGTTRGIYFANDNKAYILHGNTMSEIYSQNNQPPYPVTRVNGMYGDVELYQEQYVRLPDLDDNQMANWTLFRILNNVSRGIQFNDDGSAYIISGVNRYMLYTTNNIPPYPVDSVNGQTGTVVLFNDNNGNVAFPDFDDPNYDGWSINRSVNNTNLGLEIKDDGTLKLKVGSAEYTVYTSLNPSQGFVDDPTDKVLKISEDSTDNYWGLVRESTEGEVGIIFSNADPDNPAAYIAYTDSNDQQQTLKILTPADIPATGVVSVNTKTGIVVLYGSDIKVSSSDARALDTAISDCENLVGYYEATSTASRNYNDNQYIIRNDKLYRVTTPISSGDSLVVGTNIVNVSNIGQSVLSLKNSVDSLNTNKAERWGAGIHSLSGHTKCAGYLTNSGQNLHFFYPVACFAGMTASNFSITNLTARGISGYILNNISSLSGLTPSFTVQQNGIHIQLASATSLGTNNTPVEVDVDGSITFS